MEGGNAAHVDDSPGAEGAFKQGEFVGVSRHNGNPLTWCGLVGARKITNSYLMRNL